VKALKMIRLALWGWCLGVIKDHHPEDSEAYERWEDRQGRAIEKIERLQEGR